MLSPSRLSFFFIFSFFCLYTGQLHAQNSFSFSTPAYQAIIIDQHTNQILFEKNADQLMHPSSMSKLMTLYMLFKKLKEGSLALNDTFPVSEKAWRKGGSKMFVRLGEEVTVEDLIRGIVVQSGNDACIVVAEGISGSEETFARELTALAKSIGMENSHFINASGWPDPKHQTTAKDLATLAVHLMKDFPEYYHYFAEEKFVYNDINQFNRNRLLGVLGIDGLKTGHTEAGGYGIVLSAYDSSTNRRVVAVINGLDSDKARMKEGRNIIRHGLKDFASQTLVQAGQKVADVAVWQGDEPSVPVVAKEDVVLLLPVAAEKNTRTSIRYEGPVPAPIKEGDALATLIITLPNDVVKEVPLIAAHAVEPLGFWGRIQHNISTMIMPEPAGDTVQ